MRPLVVAATRADAGLLAPVARELGSEACVLSGLFPGTAYGADESRFPRLWRLPGPVASPGQVLDSLGSALQAERFDAVVLLGDRPEMLAAAFAAVEARTPVAHLHGGEVTGAAHRDEVYRHALSRLAHIHLPATRRAAARLAAMGEEPWRVEVVGAPGLDGVLRDPPPAEGRPEGFLLVVQHPVHGRQERAGDEMRATLAACAATGRPLRVILPNADPGREDMVEAIRASGHEHHEGVPRQRYLAWLRGCAALVGNSSSGLIEAPSFGTPVVNVGPRQEGRERAESVFDCEPAEGPVRAALARALARGRRATVNPYGDGDAASRAARALARFVAEYPRERLLEKRLEIP